MARTNQRLINYHTSGKTAMPTGSEVHYGEIVVRHNAESPELLIKVGNDSFGVFQASGAVKSAIDKAVSDAKSTLDTDISNLETSLTGHVSDFNTFKGDVKNTYATKDELKSTSGSIITAYTTAIGNAKDAVYSSATTFATNAVTTAEGELNSAIADVASDLDALSGVVKSISTDIGGNYVTTDTLNATVTTLEGKISTAQKAATDASSAYTDTKFTAAKEYSDGKLTAATETLKQSITDVDEKVDALSGNVHTTITNVQTALTETINNKVATAYRFQGSCKYADLANKEKVNGYVWNVTDAHDNVPAGTNYAWSETDKSWDALGGTVDLSPYAKTVDVNKKIETINQTNGNLQSDIKNLSAGTETLVKNFSAATIATYATKDDLKSTSGSIITAYKQAVANAKLEAIGTASGYTDTQVSAAKSELNQSITGLSSNVTNLSASTVSIQTLANGAVRTATVNSGSGVKVEKFGTSFHFDFSGLIIDCGDF